ncbi:hypothetical protein [Mucilaginibacter sp. CSA2-8R]|uniref:hypothetical protein n=1 Tax=Mucilaginibacter sp. CSA2-8R TaxID=3141542 RepID=UPI00315D66EC
MKQIYGLIILVTMLFVGGCKQDEAVIPASLQNLKLLGKWYLVSTQILTATGNDTPVGGDPIPSDSDQNYFIFRENNEATFSSTMYARVFVGYYSSNSSASIKTLKFKSGALLLNYVLESIDDQTFVVTESSSSTIAGEITTTLKRYTYSR